MRTKLLAILDQCLAWAVDVVVLPEYSVPPEIMPEIIARDYPMLIVAGTHAVEQTEKYDVYGASAARLKRGQAVAPVIYTGRVLGFQSKLNPAHPEQQTLVVGDSWTPIAIPTHPPHQLGVMICKDFIDTQSEPHLTLVAPLMKACAVLAVPSLTPPRTVSEFAERAVTLAERHNRRVLYAHWSNGGGTTIFVDEGKVERGRPFPDGPTQLEQGEEGVIVADLDLEYVRSSDPGHRSLDWRPPMRPAAAATFVYTSNQADAEYAQWCEQFVTKTKGAPIEEIQAFIEAHEEAIQDLAQAGSPTRRRRLGDLLDSIEYLNAREDVHAFLLEVVLPPSVLPANTLNEAIATAAMNVVAEWSGLLSAKALGEIRDRLRVAVMGSGGF